MTHTAKYLNFFFPKYNTYIIHLQSLRKSSICPTDARPEQQPNFSNTNARVSRKENQKRLLKKANPQISRNIVFRKHLPTNKHKDSKDNISFSKSY